MTDLLKTKRASTEALIEDGNKLEEQGQLAEAMSRYDAALAADPHCARAHLNRGNVLLATARTDEARVAYEAAIACDPQYAAAHFNLGNLNCRIGEHSLGIANYRAAIALKSDFADAFVAIGNALSSLGRPSEAKQSYQQALDINPRYAEVHFNVAMVFRSEGQYQQAVQSLRRAIDARHDFVEAHFVLGSMLTDLGELADAEKSLRHALSIAPHAEEILQQLVLALIADHRDAEATQLLLGYLERAPTQLIKRLFAACAARTVFVHSDSALRTALTAAIREAWILPFQLCLTALRVVTLDARIARCVRVANEHWPALVPKARLYGAEGLKALATDTLLHALLTTAPISSIEFERFLTAARDALLASATSEGPPDPEDLQALQFYAALSQQCFVNEYIFHCDDAERDLAAACRLRLQALLDRGAHIPPLLLLAVAAYFPLNTLSESSRLLNVDQPAPLMDLLRRQIAEPLMEQSLRAGITRLTSVADSVSEMVREQYELNPYPRWIKVPLSPPTQHLNNELLRMFPLARFRPMADDRQPEMLSAGCGTGIQSITDSQRFIGAHVLAIDLSLSSLSYALRKTKELGIPNIEYAQADILKLGNVERTFDVIVAIGVLHHLSDPFAGWRTLLSRLRPGGVMNIGLYSQIARRHILRAREFIAEHGYASTPDDIRRFRRDFARQNNSQLLELAKAQDFFSTSECRDLLFHVQEHRLTLAEIDAFLSESNLTLIGLEVEPRVLHHYRTRFPEDPTATDLHNWARVEAENPDTFTGMYVFWVQAAQHV
jgi:tetratricopeptide (TPR) repeat protein/2-polyprenyl-3-methyl-5-hydroxy-6-metoxy-1,4-benzoquinol methylase